LRANQKRRRIVIWKALCTCGNRHQAGMFRRLMARATSTRSGAGEGWVPRLSRSGECSAGAMHAVHGTHSMDADTTPVAAAECVSRANRSSTQPAVLPRSWLRNSHSPHSQRSATFYRDTRLCLVAAHTWKPQAGRPFNSLWLAFLSHVITIPPLLFSSISPQHERHRPSTYLPVLFISRSALELAGIADTSDL